MDENEKAFIASKDKIAELKGLGISKPEHISWAEWDSPQELTHRHRQIINLAAMGFSTKKISHEMGFSEPYVRKLLSTEVFKKQIKDKQDEGFQQMARKQLESRLGAALEAIDDILSDPNQRGSTKAQAASYVIDQAVGKSKQHVEVRSSTLLDLLNRIEQLPPPKAMPYDDIDRLVESILPEAIVVGRRES